MGLGYRQAIQVEEDKLLSSLSKIYRKIQRDLGSGVGATWSEVEAAYHEKTDDAIRAAVTSIYILAAKKTVENDIKIPFFLTQRDLTEIKRLSQKYQESFWLALNREVNTHNSLGIKTYYDPKTLMLVKEEDTRLRNGFIGRVAESVRGEAAAIGVLYKARQVVLQHNVAKAVRLLQAAAESPAAKRKRLQQQQLRLEREQELREQRIRTERLRITTTTPSLLPVPSLVTPPKETEEPQPEPHFVWQTESGGDPCPQCDSLEGTTYSVDDPNTPIPSEDTHPRCKCELVLEDGAIRGDIDEASGLFF